MVIRILAAALALGAAVASPVALAADPRSTADEAIQEILRVSAPVMENPERHLDQKTVEAARSAGQPHQAAVQELVTNNAAIFEQGVRLAREMSGGNMAALEASGDMPPEGQPNPFGDVDVRYRVFVSQRLPLSEVQAVAAMVHGRSDATLVVRGMLRGQKLPGFQGWILKLMPPDEGALNLTMDPERFSEMGSLEVPAIARYDGDELLAWASGTTSIAWIEEQVAAGRRGNLGPMGATVAAAEEDMIEVLKQRAAAFDWERSAAGAVDRFWARKSSNGLPRTVEARERYLDPSVEIQQTITTPDGSVIARAGDRINPLELMPFDQVLAFFDPADAAQVRWLTELVAQEAGHRVVAMASQLGSVDGLEGLGRLSDQVGTPIFELRDDVRERFHVRSVPTVVRAEGTNFLISEELP